MPLTEEWLSGLYSKPKLVGLLELVQYIAFIVFVYFYNPFQVATKYPAATSIVSLLVAFLYVTLFYFLRTKSDLEKTVAMKPFEGDFVKKLLATVIFFVLFVGATKGLFWLGVNTSLKNVLLFAVNGVILSGLLGILYLTVAPALKNKDSPSIFNLLWKFIMYLPCLLIDVLDEIKRQLQITTSTVWLLLGVEVLFIGLWFVLPAVLKSYEEKHGVHLLRHPVQLNQEHKVGNFEQLYKLPPPASATQNDTLAQKAQALVTLSASAAPKNTADKQIDHAFRYSYSLSAWFYINPQPPNTSAAYMKYTPIFTYGNKPVVEFNSNLQSLRVMAETGDEMSTSPTKNVLQEIYETKDVRLQTWNNMVVNYDHGTMDVFLNGVLVGTRGGIAPYMTFDTVVAGSRNGLHGGICNVMYYNTVLPLSSISLLYKLFRDKQFPVL